MKRTRYAHPSTLARLTRNILAVYAHATPAERIAGAGWYPTAEHGCRVWAEAYGVHPFTVASVIAALSPQCEWTSNLRAALNMVSGANGPHVGQSRPLQANVTKARRILADNALSPDAYMREGHKVRAFARNLQGDANAVTIDTHALQIALGSPVASARVDKRSAYDCFTRAYTRAALSAGIAPSAMQAITWLTWKRLYPSGVKRAMLRKADR